MQLLIEVDRVQLAILDLLHKFGIQNDSDSLEHRVRDIDPLAFHLRFEQLYFIQIHRLKLRLNQFEQLEGHFPRSKELHHE